MLNTRSGGLTGLFQKLLPWVAYALFFLIPLFFLPFTSEILELNKQVLLIVLTVIGLVAWFGQMVLTKQCTFRSGWLNVVPGAFLLVVLLSSVFSVSHYQSWVGMSGQQYTSFLSIAFFVILYYLLSNVLDKPEIQKNILFCTLLSATIVGLFATLGFFKIHLLPFDFAKSSGFTTVGVITNYLSFMICVMFSGLAMWLVSSKKFANRVISDGNMGVVTHILIGLVSLMTLLAMLAVDSGVYWVLSILGVLLLASFGFLQTNEFPNPKRFAIPLVILLVSILFFFLPSPVKLNAPAVVSPSFGSSWQIVSSTMKSGAVHFFFGSGPATYAYDFAAYKPVGINASQFWGTAFDQAKSYFFTLFATTGFLGMVTWLVLFGWLLVKSVGYLVRERDHDAWKTAYVLFVGWVLLLGVHLFATSNMTLQFLFWAFSGLLASRVLMHGWETDFSRSPRVGLLASFVFVLIGVGVLGSLFVTGQYYLANLSFQKAVKLNRANADIQSVVDSLATAIRYNGANDEYYRNLSSALLIQAQKKIGEANGKQLDADQTKAVSNLVNAAVNAATRATQIEPNRVANWVVLGNVERNLMAYAQNSQDQAVVAFTNSIKLEPINPEHRTDLARVYIALADRARSMKNQKNEEVVKKATEDEKKNLATAEQILGTAIQLKNDYLTAHYYLAGVYERQGKTNDATARLQALTKVAPADIGIGFQLSQLYIKTKNYDAAQAELERIVKINPKYSNALWYLASVYEIQKKPEKALEMVKLVAEINPDNKVVQERLNKLKAGETTTVIPTPVSEGSSDASDTSASDESSSDNTSDTVAPSDASASDTSSAKKKK